MRQTVQPHEEPRFLFGSEVEIQLEAHAMHTHTQQNTHTSFLMSFACLQALGQRETSSASVLCTKENNQSITRLKSSHTPLARCAGNGPARGKVISLAQTTRERPCLSTCAIAKTPCVVLVIAPFSESLSLSRTGESFDYGTRGRNSRAQHTSAS